jgi:hypothetical protein
MSQMISVGMLLSWGVMLVGIVVTLLGCLSVFAAGMSSNPEAAQVESAKGVKTFIIGLVLIGASFLS